MQHIQDHDHDGGVGGVAGLDHICITGKVMWVPNTRRYPN